MTPKKTAGVREALVAANIPPSHEATAEMLSLCATLLAKKGLSHAQWLHACELAWGGGPGGPPAVTQKRGSA